MNFSIKDDLSGRAVKEQIEILYISGPTRGRVDMIAPRLNLTVETVSAIVSQLKNDPHPRYNSVRAAANPNLEICNAMDCST